MRQQILKIERLLVPKQAVMKLPIPTLITRTLRRLCGFQSQRMDLIQREIPYNVPQRITAKRGTSSCGVPCHLIVTYVVRIEASQQFQNGSWRCKPASVFEDFCFFLTATAIVNPVINRVKVPGAGRGVAEENDK